LNRSQYSQISIFKNHNGSMHDTKSKFLLKTNQLLQQSMGHRNTGDLAKDYKQVKAPGQNSTDFSSLNEHSLVSTSGGSIQIKPILDSQSLLRKYKLSKIQVQQGQSENVDVSKLAKPQFHSGSISKLHGKSSAIW
jgi:hypothetical protein